MQTSDPYGEITPLTAFGIKASDKLRIVGLDDVVERSLFRTVALIVVTVDAVELWQSLPPASTWEDEAPRNEGARLSSA